jgi:FAD binding domain/Berberine and berberine like
MAIHESPTVLGDGTVAELAEAVRGEVIRPGEDAYDEARAIWNGAHDRRPALILRCSGVADVIRGVQFARSQDLLLAVRGGKHSIPGFSTCDDGMVLDLSPMQAVRVDAAAGTARAEAGVTWSVFDHETQAHGLATTGGLVSSTGLAGFTLGGGIGWLMRKHGLTCDNLLSADVVTADGRLLHASEDENADLFWGLRGGGGNFGVATSLEYRVHSVGPTITGGAIFYPGERAAEILRFYRDWVNQVPDELTTVANLLTCPPAPFLPEEWHGKPLVAIIPVHCGSLEDGERAVRPLRGLGDPVADLIGPMPYTAMQSLIDPLWGPGAHSYMKAGWMGGLDDAAIDTLVRYRDEVTSPKTEIHVHHMGWSVARVPADATAFGDRSEPFLLNVLASTFTADGYDDAVSWAQDLYGAMEPALSGGTYVNFLSNEGEERVRDAYGEQKYERLVALKDTYDPTNLFRLNQNIAPSGG